MLSVERRKVYLAAMWWRIGSIASLRRFFRFSPSGNWNAAESASLSHRTMYFALIFPTGPPA